MPSGARTCRLDRSVAAAKSGHLSSSACLDAVTSAAAPTATAACTARSLGSNGGCSAATSGSWWVQSPIAGGRMSRPKKVPSRRMTAMPSIHAVVPRQLSSTWSLVTAGRGSSIDGSALDDAPSPGTGVGDAGAVSAGAVPAVGTATSDVPSDLFSAFGRRLRLPATTRRGARETTARAARDAPRKDAIGVVGWRRASVVIVAGRLLKCALSSRRVHGKFTRGRDSKKKLSRSTPFSSPSPCRTPSHGGARRCRRAKARPRVDGTAVSEGARVSFGARRRHQGPGPGRRFSIRDTDGFSSTPKRAIRRDTRRRGGGGAGSPK